MTKLNPTEKDVKAKVKAILTHRGYFHFMPPANAYGANGISDILALRNGKFLAIETKLKKATPSTLQGIFLDNVRDCGGHGITVNQAMVEDGSFEIYLDEIEAA